MYTPVAKILFSYYLTHISRFYSGLKGRLVQKIAKSCTTMYTPVAKILFSYYLT